MAIRIKPGQKAHIEWMFDNYYINGEPFTLKDHPFLFDIFLDDNPEQIFLKSAQVGLSELAISKAIWVSDVLSGTCIYYFPTSTHIGDFVQQRIDPAFIQSPYLSKLVANQRLNKNANKVRLKKIRDGFLYFRGTQSRMEVTSVPGDHLFIDEYDECTLDNIPLAIERLYASNYKRVWKIGTPWFPDGPLEKEYKTSDARRWHIRCDHCGTWQYLDFHINFVREFKGLEEIGSSYLPYILRDSNATPEICEQLASDDFSFYTKKYKDLLQAVCHKCNRTIDRLAKGEWVAEHPKRTTHGWHINRLFSPKISTAELFSTFIRAHKNIHQLTTFYRQALGMGYDASGLGLSLSILTMLSEQVDVESIKADFVTAGIDVGSVFHIQISKNAQGKRIPWKKMTLKHKEEVNEILKMHNVDFCILDIEPETRIVEQIRDENEDRVYLCKFGLTADAKSTDESDWFQIDNSIRRILCDRTVVFDQSNHDFFRREVIVRKDWLEDATWVAQMCNPKRVVQENDNGKKRAVWVRTSDDHFRLADLYDWIATKCYKENNKRFQNKETIKQEISNYEVRSTSDLTRTIDSEEIKILRKLGVPEETLALYTGETGE